MFRDYPFQVELVAVVFPLLENLYTTVYKVSNSISFMKLTGFRKYRIYTPGNQRCSYFRANLDQWSSLEDWTFLFSVSTTEANRENHAYDSCYQKIFCRGLTERDTVPPKFSKQIFAYLISTLYRQMPPPNIQLNWLKRFYKAKLELSSSLEMKCRVARMEVDYTQLSNLIF